MFGTTFYHSTTRKYVIAFGTIFNDIVIKRTDATGNTTQLLKVPLTYAPKDKMLARVVADPNLNRQVAVDLPMMSFELKGMTYDSSRKKNTLNRIVRKNPTNANTLNYQYQSVPWNLEFELNIYVQDAEDGTKILEQILPFFTPSWNFTLNMIPEMNIKPDIHVIIGTPTSEDRYDGAFTVRRAVTWTIPFTLKGEYYGPTKAGKIIKFSKMDFYLGETATPDSIIGELVTSPGLTANGKPTYIANNSVDPNVIYVDNDFGFVVKPTGNFLK